MSLRSQLETLLPDLLPHNPEHAIKGTELIALLREKLGGEYSDASLRYHFSVMATDPESMIAKVPRSQGYYIKTEQTRDQDPAGLFALFSGKDEDPAYAQAHKALALAVRYFDIMEYGVFVYGTATSHDKSWSKPDLTVVEWPLGTWENTTFVFDQDWIRRREVRGTPTIKLTNVCVHMLPIMRDELKQSFFRALSTRAYVGTSELILVGPLPDEAGCELLRQLASEFGVGVVLLVLDEKKMSVLPKAEEIFKAPLETCHEWFAMIEPIRLGVATSKQSLEQTPNDWEIQALFDWIMACLERGGIEEYEFRVSCC